MRTAGRTSRAPIIDAGWLFLLAGIALIASVVMIPASRDLRLALWRRDRVLMTEMHRLHRITRHETYLEALDKDDEMLAYQLAMTQLGLARPEAEIIGLGGREPAANASVFVSLEPPPIELPGFTEIDSRLSRLSTNEQTRLWVLAGGAVLVLIGLLPPSITRRG